MKGKGEGMNCPKCESDRVMVFGSLLIAFPPKYLGKLSKKAIVMKEVKLQGFDWASCRITCLACGYNIQNPVDKENI